MEFKGIELIVQEGISLREIDRAREILDKLPIVIETLWPANTSPPRTELRVKDNEITLITMPDNKVLYKGINKLPSDEYEVSFQVQTSEYIAQGPYFDMRIKNKSGTTIILR